MKQYEQPITTVDVVVLTLKDHKLHILLTEREKEPFAGWLSLPGGFVFTDEDKTLDDAADRILLQKTGVRSPYFEQLSGFGSSTRDPRGWSVSFAYVSLMPWEDVEVAQAGRNVNDVKCVAVDDLKPGMLAFDHEEIVAKALERLRNKVNYSTMPAYLLPKKFTITQLQKVYEEVLGTPIDKSAFRKKVNALDFLETTGEKETGKHRPAEVFQLKPDALICFRSNLTK